jgi:anti-sigma B factor antagonist
MQVEKHMHENVTVIALDGSLDSGTAGHVQQELNAMMPEQGQILLDLEQMSYMSSAGLRVLLLVYRQSARTGARLALACVPDEVQAVLEATGFLSFFHVSATVEDGVAALSS